MRPAARGFILLEALVVIFILLLVALAAYFSLAAFRNRQVLNSGAEEVLALLHDARVRTLAARSNDQYGVNFQADRLVLFQGASYPGTTLEETRLSPLLEISNISLAGGGGSAVFKRLSGSTDNFGTVTVNLKSNPAEQAVIRIYSTGLAGVE